MATNRQMFWTGLLTGLAVGMAERMEAEIEMAPMEHDCTSRTSSSTPRAAAA